MVNLARMAESRYSGSNLSCRLCIFLPEEEDLSDEFLSVPVARDVPHLRVVSDLAPLVTGHVLIATRPHYLSAGHLANREEVLALSRTLRAVRTKYEAQGQHVLAFEHGPRTPGDAGSCVDHLHVHVLPVEREISIAEAVFSPFFRRIGLVDWRRLHDLDNLRALKRHASYLWIQDTSGEFFVTVVGGSDQVPSQALRRWCAEALRLDEWDWRLKLARKSAAR